MFYFVLFALHSDSTLGLFQKYRKNNSASKKEVESAFKMIRTMQLFIYI